MILRHHLSNVTSLSPPYALTIGSFDGVHLGHRYLLQELKKRGKAAVITFSNHPSAVLGQASFPLIIPIEQKVALFETIGLDLLFLLAFSKEMAQQPFDIFLEKVKEIYPFSFLVLGVGAAFGKGRQGDAAHVIGLSKKMQFEVEYLPKLKVDDQEVSSGRIRKLIEKGDIETASKFLGRPYSLLLPWEEGPISLEGLCLLPQGKYALTCVQKLKSYETVGYLSHYPPVLTIHFSENDRPSLGLIEVFFSASAQKSHQQQNRGEL
jgi:FAD synthase